LTPVKWNDTSGSCFQLTQDVLLPHLPTTTDRACAETLLRITHRYARWSSQYEHSS